jgi:hypothetical protein
MPFDERDGVEGVPVSPIGGVCPAMVLSGAIHKAAALTLEDRGHPTYLARRKPRLLLRWSGELLLRMAIRT